MKINVEFTKPFSDAVGAKEIDVDFDGSNVDALINELAIRYPGLKNMFFDEDGKMGVYFSVFVNDKPVTALDGLGSGLKDGDKVVFLMPISGG